MASSVLDCRFAAQMSSVFAQGGRRACTRVMLNPALVARSSICATCGSRGLVTLGV